MKTSVEAVSEIPDPEAKDEIQQIKLCVPTSSVGIWRRAAALLNLSRLSDQAGEGRGESEALNQPREDGAAAQTKTRGNKRKTFSELLL